MRAHFKMDPPGLFAAEFYGRVTTVQHYQHGSPLSWPSRLTCGSILGLIGTHPNSGGQLRRQ